VGLGSNLEKPFDDTNKAWSEWRKVPQYLKNQLEHIPQKPWSNSEGFQQWMAEQPTSKDKLLSFYPEKTAEAETYPFYNGGLNYASDNSYGTAQASYIGSLAAAESDPAKKAALLDWYHSYFPNANQSTLAEDLKQIDPAPEKMGKGFTGWDAYLKSTPPDEVEKLLKKKLKTEQDPEKWLGYVEAWAKYFSHDGGTPGHGKVKEALGKNHSLFGLSVAPSTLKRLHKWKTELGANNQADLPSKWEVDDYQPNSPFIDAKKDDQRLGRHPNFYGWTPPGGAGEGFKADPAMYGDFSHATYTAPPAEEQSKDIKSLLDTATKWEPTAWWRCPVAT
jgi:hypothetical protein